VCLLRRPLCRARCHSFFFLHFFLDFFSCTDFTTTTTLACAAAERGGGAALPGFFLDFLALLTFFLCVCAAAERGGGAALPLSRYHPHTPLVRHYCYAMYLSGYYYVCVLILLYEGVSYEDTYVVV
jgi:hypothetical protein